MTARMQATTIASPGSYQEWKVAVSLDMWAAKSGHAGLRMMGTTFEQPVHLARPDMNCAQDHSREWKRRHVDKLGAASPGRGQISSSSQCL
jgi:hypothetical protein